MATSNSRRPRTIARPADTVQPTRPAERVIAGREGSRSGVLAGVRHAPLRAVASVALVCLFLTTLLIPYSAAPSNDTSAFLTPRVDGTGAETAGFEGAEAERAVFPYLGVIERNAVGLESAWPDVSDVLTFPPESQRVRRAIIAQIYASSSGGIGQTVQQTGLSSIPDADTLETIEYAYNSMLGGDKEGRGLNGLATMQLVRGIVAPDNDRITKERESIFAFQRAVQVEPNTWQLTYNWALANFLSGNYAAAYEGMKSVAPQAEKDNQVLPPVWAGLAALRLGDPGEAIVQFQSVIDRGVPGEGNEAYVKNYQQSILLAREGKADAQWANRDPAGAYKTYFETLQGQSSLLAGPYTKWLRLGLQQRGYEGLAADMSSLMGSSSALEGDARLHHDRARLLSFLGRTDEAMAEYRKAIELGQGDAGLHVSYAEALESNGDHNGALFEAEEGIRKLGKDTSNPDFATVARAVTTNTTALVTTEESQVLLDANVTRARAWGKLNNTAAINTLAQNVTQQANGLTPGQAGLLKIYVANFYEAGGMLSNARDSFSAAWDLLKGTPPGTPGRAAALASLARDTALSSNPQAGIDVLKANGYDPSAPKPSVATDPDAPSILYVGANLLAQAGQQKAAANAMRVSAVVRNLSDVNKLSGVGRPIWAFNGTVVPANAILSAADLSRAAGEDAGLATMRYKQAYGLAPALAPAWNNLGVFYAGRGNPSLAEFYLESAGKVSPKYTLGQQNLATLAYKQGIGDFFTAESAQAAAIKAGGPRVQANGYDLRYDLRGPVPQPTQVGGDFLSRLPALVILALLLLHTIVGADRQTGRGGLVPTRGPLGRLNASLDAAARGFAGPLVTPRSGSRALAISLIIPAVTGMLGLAWAAAHGSWQVALVYLPAALVVSLLAFGANEFIQRLAARQANSNTLHHNTVLGTLLGILSIPFGFVYGWQVVTRVQPGATEKEDTQASGTSRGVVGRRGRTTEDLDLVYEAQAEAAADAPGRPGEVLVPAGSTAGTGVAMAARDRLGLTPAARIIFAGLAANLVLSVVFGLLYFLTAWPLMRLGLFASTLVLAFTAVSEPPADGWPVYRRNPALWLAVFLAAATLLTFMAAGLL